MTTLSKLCEARRRALAAEAERSPTPQLDRIVLEDMASSALDVLIHNHGVCEANHLTAYGFDADQIVAHQTEALRRARAAYAARKGVPAR